MGRKDRERFQRLRGENPGYVGYRGLDTPTVLSSTSDTETVECSICQRKRNVAIVNLPEDIRSFVCLRCQEDDSRPL